MTYIYLATPITRPSIKCIVDHADTPINLLTSFAFKSKVDSYIDLLPNARKMLDSGAYTAWSCGHAVDLDELIEYARHPRWHEVVALDVIGDADASVVNAVKMKEAGLNVMPVFHIGDPLDHLRFYKDNFAKVGLSCRFGEPLRDSLAFINKCFEVAWPYRFHSFGWISEKVLRKYPFDSADASTWVNPHRFGAVKPCDGSMSGGMRGPMFKLKRECSASMDLWMIVERYRTLERSLEQQWRRELKTVRRDI